MRINFLVGTYTVNSESQGIYNLTFDSNSGVIKVQSIIKSINPSYLKYNESTQNLYTVNELPDGKGGLSSFKYLKEHKTFNEQNSFLCHGDNPCHIQISHQHKLIFLSNYSSGSLSVFKMNSSGEIDQLVNVITYSGNGPNEKRQLSSHIHSTFLNREESQLYVQDLGSDNIYVYTIDNMGGLKELKSIPCSPGGGPRHLVFSKDEKFIYILLELTAEIAVYSNNKDFILVQTISINKKDFHGYNCAAAIKFSNDGQYLYATNRGEANCITVFKADQLTGHLTFISTYDTGGAGPRDFNISMCGNYLFIANQLTDEIVVLNRDSNSGELKDSNSSVKIPSPVCIELY